MKRFIALLLSMSIVCALSVRAEEFEFINKLDVPVEITIGSKLKPLTDAYKKGELSLLTLQAGEKYNTIVDNKQLPQFLVRQEDMPLAYIYEFSAKPGKKIYIRLVSSKSGAALEPQSFVLNSLTKEDIKLISTVESRCPINPNDTSDLSVLGFDPSKKPSKKEIQKAYDVRVERCTSFQDTERLSRLNKAYENQMGIKKK